MLVSANPFLGFSLLNFAITNLHPGIRAPGISVRRRFEIAEGVVVIAQPKRIQPGSIRRLSEVAAVPLAGRVARDRNWPGRSFSNRAAAIARLMFCPFVTLTVTTPTTWPLRLKTGLPLLPWEIGAVI